MQFVTAAMSKGRLALVLTALVVLAPAVHAHDYWFEKAGEDYLLHRGHRFSQHGGEEEVPFDPAIVTDARCLRRAEAQLRRVEISSSYPPRVRGPCLALVVSADSGYWSQTLTGTVNRGKDELRGVLRSWQALESVKRVEGWDERLRRPLSEDLELIFTGDPFGLSAGDKLRLIAMCGGEPAAGVSVAYDGDLRGVTGEDGRINLRIRHRGLQVITASFEESLDSRKADKRVRSAVLMFELE
jgi:nickel transport protein